MYSVVKGYKVVCFVITFLVVCSLLLEIIIFIPDLATRSFFKTVLKPEVLSGLFFFFPYK